MTDATIRNKNLLWLRQKAIGFNEEEIQTVGKILPKLEVSKHSGGFLKRDCRNTYGESIKKVSSKWEKISKIQVKRIYTTCIHLSYCTLYIQVN